jgi:hypothetical protein
MLNDPAANRHHHHQLHHPDSEVVAELLVAMILHLEKFPILIPKPQRLAQHKIVFYISGTMDSALRMVPFTDSQTLKMPLI